ncbi:glucosyltransferase domain-containing protein [Kluyvera intermedia]|uniref:glucosyltransferase domain-containing protein n=1 Tax=Kluyvera intermedia TaxID=61648 RepID=UPI00372D4371
MDNKNTKLEYGAIIKLLIISAFYILPIIISNRYQVDDVGRSLDGYTGWAKNGRPLADFLSTILNFGEPLTDSSPLGLILGILVLCFTISLYAKINLKQIDSKLGFLAVFMFIANPFYIENLSFKFDVLTMCISVGLLFLTFSLPNRPRYYILGLLLTSSSLMLYQASIGIYPMLTVFSIMCFSGGSISFREIFKSISIRLVVLIAAYAIVHSITYKYVETHDYSKIHSELIPITTDGFEILLKNCIKSLELIYLYLQPVPQWILWVYGLLFSCLFIKHVISITNSIGKWYFRALWILFYISLPVAVFFFSFIHIALLKLPVWNVRVFASFGCVLLFFGAITFQVIKNNLIRAIILSPILYFSFLHVYAYGNAASAQDKADTVLMSSISYDIKHITSKKTEISFYGWVPRSKPLETTIARLPLVKQLVPMFLSTNNFWSATKLRHYGINLRFKNINDNDMKFMCHSAPLISSDDYRIFKIDDRVIIQLIKPKC